MDRREYDEAEQALFTMVRTAFSAGWVAAGGAPPVPERLFELLPPPDVTKEGRKKEAPAE